MLRASLIPVAAFALFGCRVPCDPASFSPRCDGELAVSCEAGVESFTRCGSCDPATGFCVVCGDGLVSVGESCDDGNRIEVDLCDTSCQLVPALCGDGFIQSTEECDDGQHCEDGAPCDFDNECSAGDCQPRSLDGCNADCTQPACENGRQDFGEFCFTPQSAVPSSIFSSAQLRDLDGDLDLDFIAAQSGLIALFRNDGAGVFSAPSPASATTDGNVLDIGDLDGDQDLDVVTGTSLVDLDANGECCVDTGQINFLFNQGDGSFTLPVSLPGGIRAAKLFDFDADGDLDLAKSDFPRMRVMLNNGAGAFPAEITVDSPAVDGGINRIDAADLDGDTRPDLVLQLNGASAIAVLLNQGGVSLDEPVILFGGVLDLVVGDFDSDGDSDIVTSPLRIIVNDGAMSFHEVIVADSPGLFGLALINADGDARLDVVDISSAFLVTGLQESTLTLSRHIYAPSGFSAFAIGDVDGDGFEDIVRSGDESVTPTSLVTYLMRP